MNGILFENQDHINELLRKNIKNYLDGAKEFFDQLIVQLDDIFIKYCKKNVDFFTNETTKIHGINREIFIKACFPHHMETQSIMNYLLKQ